MAFGAFDFYIRAVSAEGSAVGGSSANSTGKLCLKMKNNNNNNNNNSNNNDQEIASNSARLPTQLKREICASNLIT